MSPAGDSAFPASELETRRTSKASAREARILSGRPAHERWLHPRPDPIRSRVPIRLTSLDLIWKAWPDGDDRPHCIAEAHDTRQRGDLGEVVRQNSCRP